MSAYPRSAHVLLRLSFFVLSLGAMSRPVASKPADAPAPSASASAASPLPGAGASPDPISSPQPVGTPKPAPQTQSTVMPTVAPTATPRPLGFHSTIDAETTFINDSTSGPGVVGPEAAGFIAGSPLSPNTPYDLFSSAPQVPGNAAIGQLLLTGSSALRNFDLSLTGGLGYVRGSITNASYWGESLFPTLNPHLGSQALPYAIAFPTHGGNDDGTGVHASILSGSVATADGKLRIRGGYFDLAQTDRFVFAQPALTNASPALAYAPAESLSSGLAGLDLWQPSATALPLQGIDLVGRHGLATLELTHASLPSLPGESARLAMGSFVVDHGEGTRYSAQVLHATTSGMPFATTVPFGTGPQFFDTPQGILPTSTLSGQRQTIAGVRAAFHAVPRYGVDGLLEVGRAWYDADPVARPGTQKPGGYYHAGFSKNAGRNTVSADFYRMEPRYATMILPYGVPENQWSAAFAWPGQWLKSNYQLIDNSVLGVNRQGYRVRYYYDKGPVELHLEYTDLRQIEAETTDSSTQSGFIDGYYLPQAPNAATFGRQKRYGFWTAWHPRFGDLTLDIVDDTLYRPTTAGNVKDQVSYEVPQAVLTFSRHISPTVVAAAGVGRYGMKGAFSQPIDFAERLYFAGVEVQETPQSSLLVSYRHTTFSGISTAPVAAIAPNFSGTSILLEQRFHLAR